MMMTAPLSEGLATPQPDERLETITAPAAARPTLRPILLIALAIGLLGGLLHALDMAIDGNDALFELLTAGALLGVIVTLIVGIRALRRQPQLVEPDDVAALARAKQAAETANLAKSRYLASVSHEIRSPLNAIYGYAQLFERGDGDNAQEAARVILRSAEHLTNLVEGLLDISQLEFGVLRVRSEEVQLGPYLDQIVSMLRPAAHAKGLAFVYAPPARMPDVVRLDAGRFRQVLINLLSNAIKFTEQGSVTLKMRYSGQIATFEVRDTGPGIPAEDRERIFERFERGSAQDGADASEVGRTKPGAGLGLAIARTIVGILGGKLELESEVGVGTCFRITLMLSEVAGRTLPLAPERKLIGYSGRQRRVLLVEDDDDQRQFMTRLLEALGFAVRACPSGNVALEGLDDTPLDLAILDISLPGLSGWETGAALRAHFGEDLQILMLSANSEELHRPDYNAPAHDRFLVKPVEFETLTDTVGDLLGLVWQWEDAPGAPSPADEPLPSERALSDAAQGHLAHLREYLRIGYVRGIEAEIKQLEAADPAAQALVRLLYDCLDRYDLSGMARLLQET